MGRTARKANQAGAAQVSIVESSIEGKYAVGDGDNVYTARRCFVWSGVPPVAVAPAAGGDIDGVCATDGAGKADSYYPAVPGLPVRVEAAAAFSSGASLEADVNG